MQPPTQAKPFQLKIEERVETRLNKWQDDLKKVILDRLRKAETTHDKKRIYKNSLGKINIVILY